MSQQKPWDPMTQVSESFRNIMSMSLNDPGSLQGTTSNRIQHSDFPCPFQTKSGERCFKGMNCKYKHGQYTPQILKSHPKLAVTVLEQKKNVMLSMNLPKKSLPSDGFVTLGWITTAIDPSEFYILPNLGWTCLCHPDKKENEEDAFISDKLGFETLDKLMKNMKTYYTLTRDQSDGYISGELVAVRLILSNQEKSEKGWFRAVVLEDALSDGETDDAPMVNLKLLDFGLEVRKSALDVFSLPKRFACLGPMAYKCQLFGINPLLGKWGKKATNLFREFVSGQVLIAEVKQTVYPDIEGIFEDTPILLTLHTKYKGKFINVTQELANQGLGIEWNPYPLRPSANQILPKSEFEYAVKEIKTEDDQKRLETLYKLIMQREQSRLNRYIDRLKCRHEIES